MNNQIIKAVGTNDHPVKFNAKSHQLVVDIELTNKCPIHCTFCPREKTPKKGFMQFADFKHIIDRVCESGKIYQLGSCGFGESILHPEVDAFVKYAYSRGFDYRLTTSAAYFEPAKVRGLLRAGLSEIHFSVTNMHEEYERIYGLPFSGVLDSIAFVRDEALKIGSNIVIRIIIVLTKETAVILPDIIAFWQSEGIGRKDLLFLEEHNRGGSFDPVRNGKVFNYDDVAPDIAQVYQEIAESICPAPFGSVFVGWDGFYQLCPHDWEKRVMLGHVSTHSISEINDLKIAYVCGQHKICDGCSCKPGNYLHDILFNTQAPPRMSLENFRAAIRSSQDMIRQLF